MVLALDQVDVRFEQLLRRELTAPQSVGHLPGEQPRQLAAVVLSHVASSAPPTTTGTRKYAPSRSGAWARTSSCGRLGVTTSSRMTPSTSIVCAVGGMWSVCS